LRYSLAACECAALGSISDHPARPHCGEGYTVQIRSSWLFAITISAYTGQLMSPLHAQSERGPLPPASPGESTSSDPTEHDPLPKCMARWYVDTHTTKQEWLQACERAQAEEPNYNENEVRVSEARSRCRNLVGLNAGAAAVGEQGRRSLCLGD
jgi:hypothetical protein